jgi:transketolase
MSTELLAAKLRRHLIQMTNRGKSSHIGSGLSICDILAVLYGNIMRFDSNNPKWHKRDRLILSKGHAGAAIYAVLAEKGFFSTELLTQHYQNGSKFSGHVSHKDIPGVEFSTGSLGHGLGVACGIAFAGLQNSMSHRIFCILSDGECDEGSNWEAILFASHHCLDNLVAIVDYNKLQSLKSVSETLELEPFVDKWMSFGWNVKKIDGHNHTALMDAFKREAPSNGKPTAIICDTVKGKGVSFMENEVLWHYRSPQGHEFEAAMREINDMIKELDVE